MQIKYTDAKPERLDKFLLRSLPWPSRSRLQKQIKDGLITVNGQKAPPHHFLKKNEIIAIMPRPVKQERGADESAAVQPLIVVGQTKDYLIIEKQAGLISHPSAHAKTGTLAQKIASQFPETKAVGEDARRPGLVHRLDREVSGLMVIARTNAMFEHLKEQFKNRTIQKEYTGLVHGKTEKEHGLISKPIGRAKSRGGRMAAHTQKYQDDKPALTEYYLLRTIKNYSLLRIIIHTGRTHQIRVHLYSLGHPVAGDELYQIKRFKTVKLGRLFLHASRLGFRDLAGKYVEYTSPLPEELERFISQIQ